MNYELINEMKIKRTKWVSRHVTLPVLESVPTVSQFLV